MVLLDLDDLFAFGSSEASILTDAPLAPSAITPVAAAKSTLNDDLLSSHTPVNHNSGSSNFLAQSVNIPPIVNTSNNTANVQANKPVKPADAGFNDTLAVLAQSLGKSENKWSSPKVIQ